MSSLCLFSLLPLTALASPVYDIDESGNVVIDSVVDDDTGVSQPLDTPITDDRDFEEIQDGSNVDSIISDQESEADQVQDPEAAVQDPEASDPDIISSDTDLSPVMAAYSATASVFDPDNCIIYSASYNGGSYYLLIPASYYDQIYIDENGVVWNVGDGSINCRLVPSLSVADNEWNYKGVTIYSVVQDSSSYSYNNGSLTRVRSYYQSNGRLSSSDSWGAITTNGDHSKLARNATFSIRLVLYDILAVILIGGFLCYRKQSHTS
jgi:hypothetical protein